MNPNQTEPIFKSLSKYEWAVVIAVPLLFISGIRFIAVFYATLGIVLIVASYLLFALAHYKRAHAKIHIQATMEYLAIGLFVALLYVMFG